MIRSSTRSTNAFRLLVKTLLHAGLITDRTRDVYAKWVDLPELAQDQSEFPADQIAEDAMVGLREINRSRKKIGRAFKA